MNDKLTITPTFLPDLFLFSSGGIVLGKTPIEWNKKQKKPYIDKKEIQNEYRETASTAFIEKQLTYIHEFEHFMTLVGMPLGLNIYTLELKSAYILRGIIRILSKAPFIHAPLINKNFLNYLKYDFNNDSRLKSYIDRSERKTIYFIEDKVLDDEKYQYDTYISLLLNDAHNEGLDTSNVKIFLNYLMEKYKEVSIVKKFLLWKLNPNLEKNDLISILKRYGYNWQSKHNGRIYPINWLTTQALIENLSTCKELITLLSTKDKDIVESIYNNYIKNRPIHYLNCINFVYKQLNNPNIFMAYILIFLSLYCPMHYDSIFVGYEYEKHHPSWRFISLVEAAKKVGNFKSNKKNIDVFNNNLADYIENLTKEAVLPSVINTIKMAKHQDIEKEAILSGNESTVVMSSIDKSAFDYISNMFKKINQLTEKSISTRFFSAYNPIADNMLKSIKPPFQFMGNEVFRPKFIDPEECDRIFLCAWRNLVENELLYGPNFNFSNRLLDIFFGGLDNSEKNEMYKRRAHIDINKIKF